VTKIKYIPFPNKKYKTIYADPPWMEVGGGKIKRGANAHYPLMKTKDIVNYHEPKGIVASRSLSSPD